MKALRFIQTMPEYSNDLETCDITGLERYRLTDYTWFNRFYSKLGHEHFWDFFNRVYDSIDLLEPGKKYDLMNVTKGNQELFVKIACMYINDFGNGVEFSHDWKYLLKKKR
jgi:hypothetical protein